MKNLNRTSDDMLISYRALRRVIGAIGIALPIALVLGENLFGRSGILDSISSYYWSEAMRDVLVGSLCAIGVFLLSYRGERQWDSIAGNLACSFAVGVALFPCSKPMEPRTVSNYIHYGSAAGLFLLLAYFCLFSFPGQDPGTTPTDKKPIRNGVYRACGGIILLCIIAIAALGIFPPESFVKNYVFWLEAIAIWAFGWSWISRVKAWG